MMVHGSRKGYHPLMRPNEKQIYEKIPRLLQRQGKEEFFKMMEHED
jgi:hypothetical protein